MDTEEFLAKALHRVQPRSPRPFTPFPVLVSPEFRALLKRRYPALSHHPDAQAYWRLLAYFLFPQFVEMETKRTIVPYETIAELVGQHSHAHGFKAERWLHEFAHNVLPLDLQDYRYVEGKARTAHAHLDEAILTARFQEQVQKSKGTRVELVTGQQVTVRERRRQLEHYKQSLAESAAQIAPDHPAWELLEYLNSRPQTLLHKYWKQNRQRVVATIAQLPSDTNQQWETKQWCQRAFTLIDELPNLFYSSTPRSPRLFAQSMNLNQLPRDLRRIIFTGAVELDLRACQLAVVARQWDIPLLQDFLESGGSIWSELLSAVSSGPEKKDLLKRAVYAVVFGMSPTNLRHLLNEGDGEDSGLGNQATQMFLHHPLIQALLKARSRQQKLIKQARGCADAFGRWHVLSQDAREGDSEAPGMTSLMASVVQSYELKLMLPILPILKSNQQIYILSWLHDGVTLHFGNKSKQEEQIRRLQKAVARQAREMGICSSLEVQHLTAS